MQYTKLTLLLSLLTTLSLPLVSAHGFVKTLTVDGKDFAGNTPNGNAKAAASPIRLITSGDPVKGASNPALTCGTGATPGTQVAAAMPGSTLQFLWVGEDGSHWPHNTGPMLFYLAECGAVTCDKFDTSKAKWFKVAEVGKLPSGEWAQTIAQSGKPVEVTLPKNLKAGNYIARHEIIALQLATSQGGAEFYPSCSQIKVGGSETGAPSDGDLVSLPGAYKDTDPGIFVPDVYNPGSNYVMPGPAVAAFINGGSSSSNSSSSGAVAAPAAAPASSSTKAASSATVTPISSTSVVPSATSTSTKSAASSTSTGKSTCKRKRTTNKKRAVRAPEVVIPRRSTAAPKVVVPRAHSRIMRGVQV